MASQNDQDSGKNWQVVKERHRSISPRLTKLYFAGLAMSEPVQRVCGCVGGWVGGGRGWVVGGGEGRKATRA